MGLFDFLGKKNDAPKKASSREMARLTRLAGEKMAQNYDRQEAIELLSKMGTGEAASALLRRFSFSMEPSITDQEEKEAAADGIVAAGSAALDAIRSYCAKAESLTWPLRVLRRIVPADEIVDELLGILDQFDLEYVRDPEPKIQLISILSEYQSGDVREAVEPFLGDVSEPVRFKAVSTVFAMNDPASVASLVAALEDEESVRIRNSIAQGLAQKAWVVPEPLRATCSAGLPDSHRLSDGIVKST